MRIRLFLIIAIIAGLAVSSVMADADVNKLYVSRSGDETVFKIEAAGPFQFSHQLEEAKDGKPFRVVIDLFPALHRLGVKSFYELPPSIIASIRTSQFAVNPEKVVRIVLDLKNSAVYRIEKQDNFIYVRIPDRESGAFKEWCSRDYRKKTGPRPTRQPAQPPVAKVKEAPPQAGPDAPQADPKPELAQQQPESDPVPASGILKPEIASYYVPKQSNPWEEEISKPAPAVVIPPETAEPPSTVPAVAETDDFRKPEESSGAKKPADQKPALPPSSATGKPKTSKSSGTKVVDSVTKPSKPAESQKDKSKPAPEKGAKKDKAFTKKKKVLADNGSKEQKPTSRFRRSPALPAKLKGTIVAEFPKRMVIKYTPGNARDPFATLIDDSKQTDSPVDKKVPDVETLRLVGVLESASGQNRALLEDLEGYGYILKQGDKVKKGYVSRIDPKRAYFQLFEYGWSRSVALNLGEE
ncbi:MAG: AMIN domain-containing protein [Candidatus Zixiibacteriota bacterium]|nr:MAG: AMIN domain-containing protein [candidate division Zixibacteria bacterium]